MGFFNRLANAWKIFKTSFAFIGRDKSLVAVPVLMLLSAIGFCVLAVVGLPFFFVISETGKFIAGLVFLLFFYFWTTFFGAMQSWMVHEVAQGKDTTVISGFSRAIKNLADIMSFAAVMLAVALIAGALRRRGNLGEYAGGFLNQLAGIAGKLVLPAMIVTERSFAEAVAQLRDSVKAIPEIAAFEIGIGPLAVLTMIAGILLAIALAVGLSPIIGGLFFMIFFVLFILAVIYVNNTFYTLLYLTMIEKRKVKGLDLTF